MNESSGAFSTKFGEDATGGWSEPNFVEKMTEEELKYNRYFLTFLFLLQITLRNLWYLSPRNEYVIHSKSRNQSKKIG